MRFDWQQLSPLERQVLIRHVLFRGPEPAAVTAENVCAVMQRSRYRLACHTTKGGKTVIEFVTPRGVRSGISTADTLAEGIFKAALRAKGVEVDDGPLGRATSRRSSSSYAHA